MQSIILMKIVHRTRDCMRETYCGGWGVRTPVTPAALTPMGPTGKPGAKSKDGAEIETSKASSYREEGVSLYQPTRLEGLGSVVSSPSGVREEPRPKTDLGEI